MKTNDGWLHFPPPQNQRSSNCGKMEDERVCDVVKGMSDKEMKETEQTACSVLCREMHKHKASQSEPIVAFHKLCFSLYNAVGKLGVFMWNVSNLWADICQKPTNKNTH